MSKDNNPIWLRTNSSTPQTRSNAIKEKNAPSLITPRKLRGKSGGVDDEIDCIMYDSSSRDCRRCRLGGGSPCRAFVARFFVIIVPSSKCGWKECLVMNARQRLVPLIISCLHRHPELELRKKRQTDSNYVGGFDTARNKAHRAEKLLLE